MDTTTVSNVKVEERGRKAVFVNPQNTIHHKIQMDGCVIKNSTCADWVVTKQGVGTVIVELKGKHIEHGAKQVEATAVFLRGIGYNMPKLAGLIVGNGYPKANSTLQKFQASFRKSFGGPLHVVTKNDDFVFEKVLSSTGPK
ncbi:hypothetical protein [Rhizobium sp. YTU87027]|uniref:hypothetical protein n=1 Tax=Rhizobium sp. YTU87027 TaxID=3417741 RepID=UPI003D69C912